MNGSARWMLTALVLACLAGGPAPRTGRRGPASAPAPNPLVTAVSNAAAEGKLSGIIPKLEQEIQSLIGGMTDRDLPRLTQLAALREFAIYFSRLPKEKLEPTQVRTMEWLPTQPNLLKTFALATGETDSPDDVLAILTALRIADPQAMEQYPDLATAISLVWDVPQRKRNEPEPAKLDVERPKRLMRYYMNARGRLQFDSRTLPWQLGVYMVDNVVSEDEIAWALDRYGNRGAIGMSYFDVPYDYNVFYGTGANVQSARGRLYTLENLALWGGICADQAYFATQVARSVGVPAATAAGRGGTGEAAHAWVGVLEIRGDQTWWNWDSGRYPEYQFFKGRVVDPQTREPLWESDVSLLAELYNTPVEKRLSSIALTSVIRLFNESDRAATLMKAINLSPGNHQAWVELSDLGAKMKLSDGQRTQFKQVVTQYAARAYPDFAFTVLTHSISGRGTAEQLRELDAMRQLFPGNRPDLQAELMSARGDILRKEKRNSEALAAYGEALTSFGSVGPIAMDLLEKVDELLRDVNELPRLAEVYKYVWSRMAQPETSAYIKTTPFYIIGTRYEAVLKESGDSAAAALVKTRLDSMTAASTSAQPRRGR